MKGRLKKTGVKGRGDYRGRNDAVVHACNQ